MQDAGVTVAQRTALALKRHGVEIIFAQSLPSAVILAAEAIGIRPLAYRQEDVGDARGLRNRSAKRPPFGDDIFDRRSMMSSDEDSRIDAGVEWRSSSPDQRVTEGHADAELVALGREFEALSAELAELVVLHKQAADTLDLLVQRRERLSGEGVVSLSVEWRTLTQRGNRLASSFGSSAT
jgi:hypothetical protein